MLILDSNIWISSLDLNFIYESSKNSHLDMFVFDLDFSYDNINNSINFDFKNMKDSEIIFKMPKFIFNLYDVSFLKKYSLNIPSNLNSFDSLYFYFKTLIHASKIIFSEYNIFNKRIYNDEIHEYILTNFIMGFDENKMDMYNLNVSNFFNNIEKIFGLFKSNEIYSMYKYHLLNYLFNLFYNIYSLKIINGIEYFTYLKKLIDEFYYTIHSDLILILKPVYVKFYQNTLKSHSYSELNLHYDYENLLMENEKLRAKNTNLLVATNKFLQGRVDIKNIGEKTNSIELIEISDNGAQIDYPDWFKNNYGDGLVIQSFNGFISFKLKCINDGNLNLSLRGPDFRNYSNQRMPIFIDFTKFIVNDKIIFDDDTLVWHDDPFKYSVPVKDNEEVDVLMEWTSISNYNDFNYKIYSNEFIATKQEWVDSLFAMRLDIINKGDENNLIEVLDISDEKASVTSPDWFKNEFGQGLVIQSSKGSVDLKIRCINDGYLSLSLRGVDFRDNDNQRVPICVEFKKLIINDDVIFDEKIVVNHDNSFNHSFFVKNDDEIIIHMEWSPINVYVKNKFM